MGSLINLLKMFAKGALLLIGGMLLFGGGACALIGVTNIGKSAEFLIIILIAVVLGLLGWGAILIALQINRGKESKK